MCDSMLEEMITGHELLGYQRQVQCEKLLENQVGATPHRACGQGGF